MIALKKMKKPLDNGFMENGYTRTAWQYHSHSLIGYPTKIRSLITAWIIQFIKTVNAKRCVTALILITLGTIIYYTHYVENSPFIG